MPIKSLDPSGELLVSATSIAIVLAVFNMTVPNTADIMADQPGNVNTFGSVKMATITSIAVVGVIAMLGKSPTVATVGGGMILYEAWKNHIANFGFTQPAQQTTGPGGG